MTERPTPSPLTDLDPVLTAPKRLAIAAVLSASTSTDFGVGRSWGSDRARLDR